MDGKLYPYMIFMPQFKERSALRAITNVKQVPREKIGRAPDPVVVSSPVSRFDSVKTDKTIVEKEDPKIVKGEMKKMKTFYDDEDDDENWEEEEEVKSASLRKPSADKNVAQSQEIKNGTEQPPDMPEGGFGGGPGKNFRNSVQVSSNQEQARFHPLVKKLREERKHEDEDEKQAEIPSGIGEGLKNTQVNQSSNIAFSQFESGKGHEELDSKFM